MSTMFSNASLSDKPQKSSSPKESLIFDEIANQQQTANKDLWNSDLMNLSNLQDTTKKTTNTKNQQQQDSVMSMSMMKSIQPITTSNLSSSPSPSPQMGSVHPYIPGSPNMTGASTALVLQAPPSPNPYGYGLQAPQGYMPQAYGMQPGYYAPQPGYGMQPGYPQQYPPSPQPYATQQQYPPSPQQMPIPVRTAQHYGGPQKQQQVGSTPIFDVPRAQATNQTNASSSSFSGLGW
jgi:hypothetical protein